MLPSRRIVVILATSAAVVASSTVMGATSAVGAASPGVAAGSSAPQKVIVVLRDQLSGTPASKTNMAPRRTRAVSSQDAVLAHLTGPAPTHVKHFALGNAFSATVTGDQAAALAADPAVASVIPDREVPISLPPAAAPAAGAAKGASKAATPSVVSNNQICPSDPSHPLVEPEALQSIRALTSDGSPNAQQLADGHGVKVAFIADSMDPNNPDFIRPNGQHVFVDYQDFSGDGPSAPSDGREAFGDASSIAAQGIVVARPLAVREPGPPAAAGLQHPGRRRRSGREPGRPRVRQQLLDPAGHRLRRERRPRRRDQRVVRAERLPGLQLAQRADALQRRGRRSGRHGDRVLRRRGHHQHHRLAARPACDPGGRRPPTSGSTRRPRTPRSRSPTGRGSATTSPRCRPRASASSRERVDLAAPGEGNWAVCEPGFSGCRNFQSPAAADRPAVVRRHQRVRAADRGRGRAGDPGLPVHPQRRVAERRRWSSGSSPARRGTSDCRRTSRARACSTHAPRSRRR